LRVEMLGGFTLAAGDRTVPEGAWTLRRAKTVIKLLALCPGRCVHRDLLAELLWPERKMAAAAQNLRQVVYVARRALQTLEAEPFHQLSLHDDMLRLGGEVDIDVELFERAAASVCTRPSVAGCHAALELYGGELLPEDRSEDWAAARRESLRERHQGVLLSLAELHVASGDHAPAIDALERVVIDDPLHESAHRLLMRCFAAECQRHRAFAQYHHLRRALLRELAVTPAIETRRLYHEILEGRFEPARECARVSVRYSFGPFHSARRMRARAAF
jgi:DNA-binding SARP family transcriptional activator